MKSVAMTTLAAFLALGLSPAYGDEAWIGQIKVVQGDAFVRRAGSLLPATIGERVQQSDTLITGRDGALGVTFADDSLLSIGPDSTLDLVKFSFNATTWEGQFASRLEKGTLAAKSGRLVKQTPESMTVSTPSAVLAVRGTEFVVRADGGQP